MGTVVAGQLPLEGACLVLSVDLHLTAFVLMGDVVQPVVAHGGHVGYSPLGCRQGITFQTVKRRQADGGLKLILHSHYR